MFSARLSSLAIVAGLAGAPLVISHEAHADVAAAASVKVSIKADVNAKGAAQAAAGDAAYAAGNFQAALAAYGEGFAATRDATFVYAMAHCHKALGRADNAKTMFNMYLAAKGNATLKFKAEAEAELAGKAKGAIGTVVGIGKKAGEAVVKVVDVGAGVYGAVKVNISGTIAASAKVAAKAGDDAYAAGKWADASKSYLEAYVQSQQPVVLYAAAQAKAQAGAGADARGLLLGYLAAEPKGKYAADARTLLLAVGSHADVATKVSIKAKVSADVKANAELGDKAFAAGKYHDAVKAYAEAHAKKADAALLYAKGVAQLYAGQTADAAASLKSYLAAGGKLEFKANAEAHLKACGAA
jgi:hypothetical protein